MLCDLYDSLIERLNSGLADCNSGLTWHEFKSPAEALPKASAAARKALEINPESAEAYAPLALAMSHRGDWTGAEADFDRLHERSHVPSSSGVQAGVPPEAWNPRFKRAGAELFDPHPGCDPGDEPDQRCVPRLGHSPCRNEGLQSPSSRPVVGPAGGTRSADSSRACTSTWIAPVRGEARRQLLLESRKHAAVKLLRQIPSIGAIRAALLVDLLQTPNRFRSKRQLWAYSGFAVQVHDIGQSFVPVLNLWQC